MQRIVSNAFWLVALLGVPLPVVSINLERQAQSISGEDYWFFEKLGMLSAVNERGDEITGLYFAKDTLVPFKIKKELVRDPEAKTRGYKNVVEHLIAVIRNSPNSKTASSEHERLRLLTGRNVEMDRWETWFVENRDYLVWSERQGHFVIDLEAKKAGIPSSRYRKTHTWRESP